VKLLIMQFSGTSYPLIPLRSKYSPQHPVINTLSLCSSLNERKELLTRTERKIKVILSTIRLSEFWTLAIILYFIKKRRFGDWILFPSSGGSYPDGPNSKS
jgi:hypothetical protein